MTVLHDDSDTPLITEQIKRVMLEIYNAYKSHCHFNKNTFLFEKFEVLQN